MLCQQGGAYSIEMIQIYTYSTIPFAMTAVRERLFVVICGLDQREWRDVVVTGQSRAGFIVGRTP